MPEVPAAAVPEDADDEYAEFFRALGLTDVQKTSYLARLLQSFYDVGAKLDEHLAPTGAVLHAAISRTCQGESPMDAPHHRWIRIHDRLGFFADQDDHASRIINIGLTFAYRHKELDALSAASALRLEQLRLTSARHPNPVGSTRLSPRPGEVPDGGRVIRDDGAAARVEAGSAPGAGGSMSAGGGVKLSPKDNDLGDRGDRGDLAVPDGGLEVRRDPLARAAVAVVHAGGGGQDMPEIGGTVVARRQVAAPAGNDGTMTESLMVTAAVPAAVHVKEQPLVKPSPQAVACTTAVLEAFMPRDDAKGVVRQLLVDSLLCWGRLHSGQTAKAAAGVISAAEVETEWPAVRKLLSLCWPTWSTPIKNVAVVPPEGSVSRQTHPGRMTLTSRWKLKVDMTAINPTIRKWDVKADRNFKRGPLDDSVEVQRIASGLKVPMAVTVASILLVGTWDPAFCTIMQQLVASGRAPVHRKASVAAAACHDFELANPGLPQALEPTVAASADRTDDDRPALATSAAPLAAVLETRQAEVDHLLAVDKADTAGASRARRILARRRERLSVPRTHLLTADAGLAPDSSSAPASVGGSKKRPASHGNKSVHRKKAAVKQVSGVLAGQGGMSMSQVTAAPTPVPPGAPPDPIPEPLAAAGSFREQPVCFPSPARIPPDEQRTISVPPSSSCFSTPGVPASSLSSPPPTPVSVDGGGGVSAEPSGSGRPPLVPSRLPAGGDLHRVTASVQAATLSAESLLAVRFPSVAPLLPATMSHPAPTLGAPFDSDSDAEVAMMDEEEAGDDAGDAEV